MTRFLPNPAGELLEPILRLEQAIIGLRQDIAPLAEVGLLRQEVATLAEVIERQAEEGAAFHAAALEALQGLRTDLAGAAPAAGPRARRGAAPAA